MSLALALSLLAPLSVADDARVPLVAALPQDAPVVAEWHGAGAMIDAWLDSPAWATIERSAAWLERKKKKDMRDLDGAIKIVSGLLHAKPRAAFAQALGDEVVVAFLPPRAAKKPVYVLATRASSAEAAETLAQAVETLVSFTPGDASAQEDDDGDGIRSTNGTEFHAVVGDALLVASERALLVDAIARLNGAAIAPRAPAGLRMRADLEALRAAKLWKSPPKTYGNALPALVAYGVQQVLERAQRLELALEHSDRAVRLHAIATPAAIGDDLAWCFPDGGAAPDLALPDGTIATLDLTRDFGAFYAARQALLDEDLKGKIVEFDSFMGILFAGRSFGDEVLPALGTTATLIVGPQDYAALGRAPRVQIPGFTLALRRTADGKELLKARDLLTAFQTTLGVVNADRGQKGLESMLQNTERVHGVDVVSARFLQDEDEPGPPELRFNAEPALAVTSDVVFISSARSQLLALLAAQQAREQDAGQRTARPTRYAHFGVSFPELERILAVNEEPLVANRMVEEGEDEPTARAAVKLFLDLLRGLDDMDVALDRTPESLSLALDVRALGEL